MYNFLTDNDPPLFIINKNEIKVGGGNFPCGLMSYSAHFILRSVVSRRGLMLKGTKDEPQSTERAV